MFLKLTQKAAGLLALTALFSCQHASKNIQPLAEMNNEPARAERTYSSEELRLAKHAHTIHQESQDEGIILGSSLIESPETHERKTYYLYGAEHLELENYYFDIPVVYNAAVKKWMNYFLSRGRNFFERYSARAGRYAPLMGKILDEQGLPRDLIFLAMAESGFQNKAKSWAKAVGPWQFMPYTGKRFGLDINWYIDERRDPIKATIAASQYLKKLYDQFGSWELAAAGYNAGEGKVSRAIRRYRTENFWKIARGRYLKSETRNYVPKIMALAIIGKNLKTFGFDDIDFHEPLDFEEFEVHPMTDLVEFSRAIGVDFEEVQRLNPEVLRWFTPPNQVYKLRLPVGVKKVAANVDLNQYQASAFQKYRIRGSRSNLKDVAKKFKIKDVEVLSHLNKTKAWKTLPRSSSVQLPFRVGQSRRAAMYADLYDKPRKSIVRRRKYKKRIRLAKSRGKAVSNPTVYYTVKRGDSLWSVSRKTGVPMDTIIVSNLHIIKNRRIRPGDRLAIR